MDAVQAANSGHPGAPMGMADIAEVLWNDYLKHNPGNARWVDRDRFVLSNGHGSMLLYSVLHLSGYDLSIDEIRNFRQLGYRTAGHPEYEPDLAIETTTGPLGQGLSNAVGMALSEKMLAASFNRPGFDVVDHRMTITTYPSTAKSMAGLPMTRSSASKPMGGRSSPMWMGTTAKRSRPPSSGRWATRTGRR
jgi:transketolase